LLLDDNLSAKINGVTMIEYTVRVGKTSTEWCLNGLRHRQDGPALEYDNGDKYWFINGKLHREDGPAHEYASGNKVWYLNGKFHRQDGPAIEHANGNKVWFLNGKEVTEDEVMKPVKKLTVAEIEVLLGYKIKIVA
jgi:hypothetical protein